MECYPFGEAHHLVASEDFDITHYKEELSDLENLTITHTKPTIEDMFIKLMKR
jgi:hypothetical protein